MPDEEKLQKYLRKVTAELQQARRRLAAAESQSQEPIAVLGIGCRFPGGVRSPEDLWDLVDSGGDAVGGLPAGRGWQAGSALDGVNAGFIHGVEEFDPYFFGLDPVEAAAMDPQQRLLLETTWEAFERAGIDPVAARGSRTAVYAGVQFGGYPLLMREAPPPQVLDHLGLGNSVGAASGRLAYQFGLLGGAVTVDTQCTSSIVALHLAVKALRNGECALALAGGACVMSLPTVLMDFHRRSLLAPDGRSKSFAAAADGVSLAEGAGMLLLERLSDARRNGHPVMAVIRGTAINQDGATNGIISPSGRAQERVIRAALADGRVTADSVDAVEGHGVGATLGDGVEVTSLLSTYGQERPAGRPLLLGSVKSNIGHTQTVGAVAGIVKLVMALRNERLPRTVHVDGPTPHADWSSGTVRLLTEPEPWRRGERVRRAGLTCLTLSGTNGHLILEEPPADEPAARPANPERTVPLVLSAKSPTALREQAERLRATITAAEPVDVGHSLHTTRSSFRHRAVVLGTGREELAAGLDALAGDRTADGLVRGVARAQGQTALLFGGAGDGTSGDRPADAEGPRTARGLYEAFPAFAEALDEVTEHLAGLLGPEVRAAVREPGPACAEPTVVGQAVAFALNTALHRLLTAFAVRPDATLGHGAGEVAAAYAAGALSLADGAALVTALGRITERVATGPGASVWVRATEDEVRAALSGSQEQVGAAVAAVDEPGTTVVSGDAGAVARVAAHWRAHGRATGAPRPARLLLSPDDEQAALAELRAIVAGLAFREPEVPLLSTVTGQPVEPAELRSAEHWLDHLRGPTRFLDGVRRLRTDGVTRLVGLDLSGDLTGPAGRSAAGFGEPGRPLLLASVPGGGRPPGQALLSALGELHTDGVAIDWSQAFEGRGARRVDLPTYPYQKVRCWLVPPEPQVSVVAAPPHPLLGTALDLVDATGQSFTQQLTPGQVAGVFGQQLYGTPVLPAGARLEWLLAAARHGSPDSAWTLTGIRLPGTVSAASGTPVALQTSREDSGDGHRVRAFVKGPGTGGGRWAERGGATVVPAVTRPAPDRVDPESLPEGLAELDVAEVYRRLWRQGSDYAEPLRVLRRVWLGGDEAVALVGTADVPTGPSGWSRWAAVLEAAVQLAALSGSGPRTPVSVDRLEVSGPPSEVVWLRVRHGADGAADAVVLSGEGVRLAAVQGLRLRPMAGREPAGLAEAPLERHEVVWHALAEDGRPGAIGGGTGSWLVFSDDPERAAAWCDELALFGVPAVALAGEDAEGRDGTETVPVGTGDPDVVGKTFAELRERGVTVAGLLVHDAGDAREPASGADDPLDAACRRGGRTLALVRGFLQEYAEQTPRIVLCSAGAAAGLAGGPPHPAQAPLTALFTSLVWEHPELPCAQVDLDPAEDPPTVVSLLGQVMRLPGAGRLAVRGGRWFEARLERRPAPADRGERLALRPDATYLVAGGDTRHAAAALEWLAARGARSVVLAGAESERGDLAGARTTGHAGIERLEHVAVDLSSAADVARLAELCADGRPPLRGVLLLPQPVAGGGLDELDGARFGAELAGALRGPVELTRRFTDVGLTGGTDFFVLSTSVVSLPGRAGTVVGSAADAFLTALARHHRQAGLPVVAAAWGPWLESVDESDEAPAVAFAEAGVYPAPGGEMLDALLPLPAAGEADGSGEAGLARVDWDRYLTAGHRPLPYTVLETRASYDEEKAPGFGQNRMKGARKKKG
ncbi:MULTISPECIES: type I polyketide synthase [Streptomyces]|nr:MULTISPECIES: type I polyketide synthase [Streptomyces]MYS91681.1 type I polyketide synthase [Streptomyces sp. SID5464]SOR83529.1 Beta-ketoacyl-acyl-carrier-protein synthase I [Streptomyces chartreusis NRRL 3882]